MKLTNGSSIAFPLVGFLKDIKCEEVKMKVRHFIWQITELQQVGLQ